MKIFVCINDLIEASNRSYDVKEILGKESLNHSISGIFFYSNSVVDLTVKRKLKVWKDFAKKRGVPLYVCINSLSSKNLSHKIDPAINIVGLGKLVEGVVSNEKTLVIGKL